MKQPIFPCGLCFVNGKVGEAVFLFSIFKFFPPDKEKRWALITPPPPSTAAVKAAPITIPIARSTTFPRKIKVWKPSNICNARFSTLTKLGRGVDDILFFLRYYIAIKQKVE